MINQGIPAVKYNYANQKPHHVTIFLNKDLKSLRYVNKTNLPSMFKNRDINFDSCEGLIYGAHSFTFATYRLKILNEMKLKNTI
jgi:hypothetical protein